MRPALLILSLLIAVGCSAQLPVLRSVHKNRATARNYRYAGKFDSAYMVIGKYINNEKYTNASDWLMYCTCAMKMGDTANFITYLSKGIDAGYELSQVRAFTRGLTGDTLLFLENFLDANYEKIRRTGYAKYDTALINEIKLIHEMDQLVRKDWKMDSNMKYRSFIGHQLDSINYERVVKLFESGKYPGFHNCGMYAANITFIMMHITDSYDDRFQYVFKKIKAEVLEGNISPDEVATFADRHYTGTLDVPKSYYGSWRGRVADLYDCKNVDKFRSEIGLEDLKSQYEREHWAIPECYNKR